MRASIQFNDEFPARRAEIGDVLTDGVLPPEMDSIIPQSAKISP
jgi:hypothetical protein